MRPQAEVDVVLGLVRAGWNDCQVSRRTGVPRSTVREWRVGKGQRADRSAGLCTHDFRSLPVEPYAYLLGAYLGDGCLSPAPRGVWRLRLSMDARYRGILDECARAMELVMPGKRAHRFQRPAGGLRQLTLCPWQERIVARARRSFLRGLIHSDGCRIVANDRGVPSPRYHFSNLSEDIKRMFCESLDALDIPWTRPSDRQIAVYRRSAVHALDEFIGPKA